MTCNLTFALASALTIFLYYFYSPKVVGRSPLILLFFFFSLFFYSCVPSDKPQDGYKGGNKSKSSQTAPHINAVPNAQGSRSLRLTNNRAVHDIILTRATDADNDVLLYTMLTLPTKGRVKNCLGISGSSLMDLSCQYVIDSSASLTGSDYFSYKVTDGHGGSDIVWLTITLVDNSAPALSSIFATTFTFNEVNSTTASAQNFSSNLAEASDADSSYGDTLSYFVTTLPQLGVLSNCLGLSGSSTASSAVDLSCSFNPNITRYGSDYFEYSVFDSYGSFATSRVNLSITKVNTAPNSIASSSFNLKVKKNSGTQSLTLLTSTDVDVGPPSDVLSYIISSTPAKGALESCLGLPGSSSATDLLCLYTPSIGSTGTDSFTYAITDDGGDVTTVTVPITLYNETPTAISKTITPSERSTVSLLVEAEHREIYTSTNDISSISITSSPYGTISSLNTTLRALGTTTSYITLDYTALGYEIHSTDSFSFLVTDDSGDSATGTISINLVDLADSPVMENQSIDVLVNSNAYAFFVQGASDRDVSNTAFTYQVISNLPGGTGTLANCMNLTGSRGNDDLYCNYTPPANTQTEDPTAASTFLTSSPSFTVQATDSTGLTSNIATINFNIKTNNSITANSQTITVVENSTFNVMTLNNAISSYGGAITYTLSSTPSLGNIYDVTNSLLTSSSDITNCFTLDNCSFTPTARIYGSSITSFKYLAQDTFGKKKTATVYFNVTSDNSAPSFASDTYTFDINYSMDGQSLSLSTASDVDSDTLTYTGVALPATAILSNCVTSSGNSSLNCTIAFNTVCGNSTNFTNGDDLLDDFTYKAFDPENASDNTSVVVKLDRVIPRVLQDFPSITFHRNTITTSTAQLDEGCFLSSDHQVKVRFSSSNNSVIQDTNVYFRLGATSSWSANDGTYQTLDSSGVVDISNSNLQIKLVPESNIPALGANNTATTSISLQALLVDDGSGRTFDTLTSTFLVTVDGTYLKNGGWYDLNAVGKTLDYNYEPSSDIIEETSPDDSSATINLKWYTPSSSSFASGVSLSSFQIYRSTDSLVYDLEFPVTSDISNTTISRVYSDEIDDSLEMPTDPHQGQVFYYRVYGMDNLNRLVEMANTNDVELRMIAPPANKAFIHRWEANRIACSELLSTSFDTDNNYRCRYKGPGSTSFATLSYYDQGYDLLVDRFEAGCPFSKGNFTCFGGTEADDALGIVDPSNIVATDAGKVGNIYYNRGNGQCYAHIGSINRCDDNTSYWLSYKDAPTSTDSKLSYFMQRFNYPHLPPLTNLSVYTAAELCSSSFNVVSINDLSGGPYSGRLLSRKEQILASSWQDWKTTDLEPVSGAYKCNTSTTARNSLGINSFTSSSSATFNLGTCYWPGITERPIIETGSEDANLCTPNCQSRFSLQHMVGNVGEWLNDAIASTPSTTNPAFIGVGPILGSYTDGRTSSMWVFDLAGTSTTFAFNKGYAGPCPGTTSCSGSYGSWQYDDSTSHGAFISDKVILPMGLPLDSTFYTANSSNIDAFDADAAGAGFMFHDSFSLDEAGIASSTGAAAAGGSYNMDSKAGAFQMSIISGATTNTFDYSSIGFRCAHPIPNP